HIEVNGRIERVHASVAVAAENDRLHIAGIQLVNAHELAGDIRELVDGAGKLHAVNSSGVDEPLHVFAKAEDGRTLRRFVAADAFENGGTVADDVRKDVELGVVPVDPFAVVPDFLRRSNRHICSLWKVPRRSTES